MTTGQAESGRLIGVEVHGAPDDGGGQMLDLVTAQGAVRCRLHAPLGEDLAVGVVWVFGAGGGLGGPAGGVYERLARRLRERGVTSLQVDYRQPGRLDPCVHDTLAGAAFLEERGAARIAFVGHSFGGAVVIRAGARCERVAGVAALSSQLGGTEQVAALGETPLLLAHGEADEVLPASCSRDIARRATGPKELVLYPGCRHGLDGCRDALDRDLVSWLEWVLRLP